MGIDLRFRALLFLVFLAFFNAIDMMHDHDGTTVSSSFSKCSLLTRFLFFWNTLHVSQLGFPTFKINIVK
jgi:hypothetical protein